MSRAAQLRPRMTTGGLLPRTPPGRFVRSATRPTMARPASAAGRISQMVGLPTRKRSPAQRMKDAVMGAMRSMGLAGSGPRWAKRRGSGRSPVVRGKTGAGGMAMAAGAAGLALKNRDRLASMMGRQSPDKPARGT